MHVVESLLRELELGQIPCLKVFNKIDLLSDEAVYVNGGEKSKEAEGVAISALDRETFSPFLDRAQQMIRKAIGV